MRPLAASLLYLAQLAAMTVLALVAIAGMVLVRLSFALVVWFVMGWVAQRAHIALDAASAYPLYVYVALAALAVRVTLGDEDKEMRVTVETPHQAATDDRARLERVAWKVDSALQAAEELERPAYRPASVVIERLIDIRDDLNERPL